MIFRSGIFLTCTSISLEGIFDRCFIKKEFETLNMLVKAMYDDPEAVASWEEYCFWRDEEFRRSDELKRITHLLSTILTLRVDSLLVSFITRIGENRRRLERLSQRQPQGDGKSTRLAAVMPVPPMISTKGGLFYTLRIGV